MGAGETTCGSRPGSGTPARGLQPRIVLGLLGAGSFAGTWLTHLGGPVSSPILTWFLVVSLGVLLGGLYWRVVFFDRDAFETRSDRRSVQSRWGRLEAIAVSGTILAGAAYLTLGVNEAGFGFGGITLATGLVFVAGLRVGMRWVARDGSTRRESGLRSGLLLVIVVSLGAFAWLETGGNGLSWLVRVAHLGAFSLWIGGAVWHNFIMLPTVRARPAAAAPVKSQARRFRRYLPFVIVLLLATGVYQTDRLLGLSVPSMFGSEVGHLVGFKLLVSIVLTGMVIAKYSRTA